MKKYLITAFLILFTSLTAYAENTADFHKSINTRGNNNRITIYNNTNSDISYIMETFSFSAVYAIPRGRVDVYHSKYADEYLTVNIGVCKRMGDNDSCVEYEQGSMQNCVNNVHYNGNLIDTIQVNSLTSCTVTCLDGSTTSCKQSG